MNILEKVIIEKISVIYAVFNQDFQVCLASEDIKKFAITYPSNIIGKDIRNYFPELFGLEHIMMDIIAGKQNSFVLEGICREDELSQKSIYFNLQILAKSDGYDKQLIILFEDVTNRFQVQQKLVQIAYEADLNLKNISTAKAYIDNLIKSMADALFVTNIDFTIEQINPAAEQVFGYSKSELVGQSLSLIIPDVSLLNKLKKIRSSCQITERLFSPNCRSHVEVSCYTKTGGRIVVAFSCSMFLTEITELQHYIYIGRDITDRQRMEAELKQTNKKLTKSVNQLQERNREITRLSELTHRLQGCFTLEEAYEAIGEIVPLIFPHSIGAILTNFQEQQPLEIVAHWGDLPMTNLKNFSMQTCHAWQKGERYLNCAHLLCSLRQSDPEHLSQCDEFCIPMVVQGQTVGLLYLSLPKFTLIQKEKQELAMTVAEHIGLALANLKLRETLKNQSVRDPLTGLFNRRYFEETMEREIQRASEKQKSLGLIILDVDHFKRFNDTFGHQAGDAVLQAVSKLLIRSLRNVDLACRYGGEEFIVILRDASLKVTQARAEKLRSEVKLLRLEHGGQSLGSISSSFGVACFPQHGQTLPELVAAADAALYQAKESGRDRVVTAA